MTNNSFISLVESLLLQNEDSEYATKMANYMKGHFTFYGVRGPDRVQLLRSVKSRAKDCTIDDLISYVPDFWERDQREFQYVMIDLLKWRKTRLQPRHLLTLEYMLITKSWWDSVDLIAANLIGEILKKDKQLQYECAERWIESEDMWLRRTAIIHQLRYGKSVDQDLLFALVESQKGSSEFFINKACGWALRQYSKYNPSAVSDFLELHPDLSGLTLREAKKYL